MHTLSEGQFGYQFDESLNPGWADRAHQDFGDLGAGSEVLARDTLLDPSYPCDSSTHLYLSTKTAYECQEGESIPWV